MITNLLRVVSLVVVPFALVGLINRVKSLWSGRKGPPLLQPAYDALRLLRKSAVYSHTTTPLFRVAPWVFVLCGLASAVVTPLLGAESLFAFSFDFIWFAYVWALGRVALMLAALDTGSAFEGMGAAREATFSTLVEPALFLALGALCLGSGAQSLSEATLLEPHLADGSFVVWLFSSATLLIVLQVETARFPIDDPATHLELTMVHEVMVLDHSGPDLAAIQYGSALKLYLGISLLAALLNPVSGSGVMATAVTLALCTLIAVMIGSIESLIARLKLRAVPKYIGIAVASGAIALLATAWRAGGTP